MQIVIFLPTPVAPGAPSFVFLPMPTVSGCDDLCQVCRLLYFYLCQLWRPVPGMQSVIFLYMPAVTTRARYVDYYISTCVSCDDLCRVCGLLYFYLDARCEDLCRVCSVLYFYLCQAVITCAGYVECYISSYASCDDLCRVNRVLYLYLC